MPWKLPTLSLPLFCLPRGPSPDALQSGSTQSLLKKIKHLPVLLLLFLPVPLSRPPSFYLSGTGFTVRYRSRLSLFFSQHPAAIACGQVFGVSPNPQTFSLDVGRPSLGVCRREERVNKRVNWCERCVSEVGKGM